MIVNEQQLKSLAVQLAPHLRAGDVVTLSGDLGAGKSTFARALIRAIMADETLEVASPTFTLLNTYEAGSCDIWHVDAYRLNHPAEAVQLGLDDALHSAIILVEWPENILGYLPADALVLCITRVADDNLRQLTLTATGQRGQILLSKIL